MLDAERIEPRAEHRRLRLDQPGGKEVEAQHFHLGPREDLDPGGVALGLRHFEQQRNADAHARRHDFDGGLIELLVALLDGEQDFVGESRGFRVGQMACVGEGIGGREFLDGISGINDRKSWGVFGWDQHASCPDFEKAVI